MQVNAGQWVFVLTCSLCTYSCSFHTGDVEPFEAEGLPPIPPLVEAIAKKAP